MSRCYGCCQENCGYKTCSCDCHHTAEGAVEVAKRVSRPNEGEVAMSHHGMDEGRLEETQSHGADPELAEAFAELALNRLLDPAKASGLTVLGTVTYGNALLSVTVTHKGEPASFTVTMSFEKWLKLAHKMGKSG